VIVAGNRRCLAKAPARFGLSSLKIGVTNMRRSLFLPLAVLALLTSTGTVGCGFIFTHGPPKGYEQLDYFSCTESNTGPILDVIGGGLYVIGIVTASSEGSYLRRAVTDQDYALMAALAATLGVAAGVGFSKTSKCRKAKQEYAARQAGSSVEPQGVYLDMPGWAYTTWYNTGIYLPKAKAVSRKTP